MQDWGSGAYDRGVVLSESFAWDEVEEMQVGMPLFRSLAEAMMTMAIFLDVLDTLSISDCNPEGPSLLSITAFAADLAPPRHFTPPPIPPLPLAPLPLSLPTSLLWKRFLCYLAGKRDSKAPCVKLTRACVKLTRV